jgi:hypothetical protein
MRPLGGEPEDDFCLPAAINAVLVSDRVATCVSANSLTGFDLTPLDEAMFFDPAQVQG